MTSSIIPHFKFEVVEKTANYGKFQLTPLEGGFGHTIGHALRRVLLTSLSGASVVEVKINKAKHQFDTLSGVKEDVAELILNLKTIRPILIGETKEAIIKLSKTGPGKVTAKDFDPSAEVEIANPDLHLAELADKKTKLEISAVIKQGTGYELASQHTTTELGVIAVDAIYSPVERINYTVQDTRVGSNINYDKLIFEIWTDGSRDPEDSILEAAEILRRYFVQIIDPQDVASNTEPTSTNQEHNENLQLTVEELDLPTRVANALRNGGYQTVGDLSQASLADIAKVKNLGSKSVTTIQKKLEDKGVQLK